MAEIVSAEYRSLEEYRRRASLGDTEALYYMAWYYFKGRLVPKDLPTAISFLRQLEFNSPEFARFNIAKIKFFEGDPSLEDDIKADCEAGFGPALYLMGANSYRKAGKAGSDEALHYFDAAARSGHLLSKVLLWRHSELSFWQRLATLIPVCFAGFCFIAIKVRNSKDTRVWI